ncbi:MAG: protein translocase subunit SecF [Proteobacteria bacterium]|jgi:preprotein translocase subunit SecF|nr:protein translocase subunit SecF [Pseudomonadota bacterium]NBP15654.1 protein translocase subunit SecF [bacterium]
MIDFLKYRFFCCFVISFSMIAAGIGGYLYNGGFKYSVDFTGGTQVLLKFDQNYGLGKIKESLSAGGWEATVFQFGNDDVAIRVQEFSHDSQGLALKLKEQLSATFNTQNIEILEANAVGPGVGASLRWNSILAVLIALFSMLLYIAFRFWSFSYGMGAVVAILHDAVAILALFALTQREISPNVIGAMLATLGYSINDTIVIFARIRENFVKMKGQHPDVIVNTSINQTLSRTILTSLSTTLVVVALLVFGGEALRNLSLALLVGIVVGTYSSIYVASPIMLMLRKDS